MRAVVVAEDRTLEAREVDDPVPGEGEVRVRVAACGICGTDLHGRSSEMIPAGSIMGHELTGEIDMVGRGVEGFGEGDRVAVFPFRPLDHHDIEVAMTTGVGLGARPGGFADAVVVDHAQLWRLPEGLQLEHGALVEPLAVALHALNVAAIGPEEACAVIGAGPIGVMVAVALRARGVENLVLVEKNERRRRRAENLGFATAGLEGVHARALERLGAAPAVVFECAGAPAAPGLAVELVGPNGRVILMGVLEEPVTISQLMLMLKHGEIRASINYLPRDFDEAIELLASGRVPADGLITAREPLERAQEVFDDLESPDTQQIKVLLRP